MAGLMPVGTTHEMIPRPIQITFFPSSSIAIRWTVVCPGRPDRKSTRLNSSHSQTSYAVFCLKKKKACDLRNLFVTPLVQHLEREHRALVVIELCQRSLHDLIAFFIEELIHRHARLIDQIKAL